MSALLTGTGPALGVAGEGAVLGPGAHIRQGEALDLYLKGERELLKRFWLVWLFVCFWSHLQKVSSVTHLETHPFWFLFSPVPVPIPCRLDWNSLQGEALKLTFLSSC